MASWASFNSITACTKKALKNGKSFFKAFLFGLLGRHHLSSRYHFLMPSLWLQVTKGSEGSQGSQASNIV